jgi:hypothetical protein
MILPYRPITDTTTALDPVLHPESRALAPQLRPRTHVVARGHAATVAMEVVLVLL